MSAPRTSMILAAFVLGGCATGDPHDGQRTVFSNPYAAPVIGRTGIGPQCEVRFGRDSTCLDSPALRSWRGRRATLENGKTVRLTRTQARLLRERAELNEARRNQPSPSPAPVLPTAESIAERN